MNVPVRESRALRAFSLCGIAAPFLDMIACWIAAARQPDYNVFHDFISQLTVPDRPDAGLVRGAWIAFPFVFGPFPVAVYRGTRGARRAWLTPLLLAVFAVGIGLSGLFHCDPGCRWQTFSARVHILVSSAAAVALAPCPIVFWLTTRHDARWRGSRRLDLALQGVGLVALALMALAFLHRVAVPGLLERLFWGVYYLWVVCVAVRLYRLGRAGDRVELAPAGAA